MKTLILTIVFCSLLYPQSRIESGVRDNPIRNYQVYAEVKTDTSTSVLVEDLDILKTNISQYLVNLENQITIGDTLFGEFDVAVDSVAYIKVGAVVISSRGKKPSLMKATKWWKKISSREPKPLDIFIEEK